MVRSRLRQLTKGFQVKTRGIQSMVLAEVAGRVGDTQRRRGQTRGERLE